MRRFVALICGYGVPKDIFLDPNYQAYLHAAVNWLFARYNGAAGTIVPDGGPTDLFPPYKRTEAGEMAKWLRQSIAVKQCGWKVHPQAKSLSTVENLLNFRPPAGTNAIIFCEATRARRVRSLTKIIPALRRAKVVGIDFDTSPRRYDEPMIKKHEQEMTRLERRAAQDPHALRRLRAFMQEKLQRMRQYSPEEAHRRLPEILASLQKKYEM